MTKQELAYSTPLVLTQGASKLVCLACERVSSGTFGHGGPPICRDCYDHADLKQLVAEWEKENDAQK